MQTNVETERFAASLRRRYLVSISILVSTVVVSTAGFYVLGEERYGDEAVSERLFLAFWDTLNLVTTIGFVREDFTIGQRVWAIFVIVVGLAAVLSAFSTFMGVVLGKEVRSQIKRTRMKNALTDYQDHIVLCGYGAVGEEVGRHFLNERKALVVIERDDVRADIANHEGYFVIQGDCTEERVLKEAGVERASGLIATLDSDASNVFLILMARELNPKLRIVARAGTENARLAAKRAGADRVIVPGVSAGTQLSQLILKPRMSEFMAAAVAEGEYDFAEIDVATYPGMVGKMLRDLNLPKRAATIVISIVNADGEQEFSPGADRVLQEEDTLLVVYSGAAREKLESFR